MDWGVFLQRTPSGDATYLGWIAAGLGTTVGLSVSAWILALLLGSAVGVLRTVPGRLARAFASAWVELFRNVPLLVQLFLWYFVAPELAPAGLGTWFKQLHPFLQQFVSAMLCLAFFTSARVAEQVRAGIEALSAGQRAAGLALGFTLPQTYRHVLLPMAFRIVVPPLTSEILNLFKNSAVASTIGLLELAAMGRQLGDYTARMYESFVAVTAAYVAVNLAVLVLMRRVERWARVPGYLGGGGR